MRNVLATVALSISLGTPAQAQPVVIDMDADVIEGSGSCRAFGCRLHPPDVVLTLKAPKTTHRNLIRIRRSFAQELLASASKI